MKLQKIVLWVVLFAAGVQGAFGQAYQCDGNNVKPPDGYQLFLIDASTMTQKQGVTQYKDDDKVFVEVVNINPFVATYVIKIKRTPVQESAIASFLQNLGGIVGSALPSGTATSAGGAATAAQPQAAAKAEAVAACKVDFTTMVQKPHQTLAGDGTIANPGSEKILYDNLARMRSKYSEYTAIYTADLGSLTSANKCPDIPNRAVALQGFLNSVQSPDGLILPAVAGLDDSAPTAVLLQQIGTVESDAKALQKAISTYRSQTMRDASCAQDLIQHDGDLTKYENEASQLLYSSEQPSTIQQYRNVASDLGKQYMKFAGARTALGQLLDRSVNPNPFILTQEITDNQADVQVDVVKSSAVDLSGGAVVTVAAKGSTPDTPVFSRVFHFGYGARFNISGGLVVSTLPQRQYTTATNTVPNSTAANMIVYQNNSSTRLSPILLLNGRLADCDPSKVSCLLVPYMSFGITAKNDGKSTNAEYLIGPSWGLISRNLFLTVGAYAGQQQTLQGGLKVGDPTSLSSANLPITTGYHWNVGFAISWKIK